MSTCQGAPAPHLNCPHGAACDWTPPATSSAAGRLLVPTPGLLVPDHVAPTSTPSDPPAPLERAIFDPAPTAAGIDCGCHACEQCRPNVARAAELTGRPFSEVLDLANRAESLTLQRLVEADRPAPNRQQARARARAQAKGRPR